MKKKKSHVHIFTDSNMENCADIACLKKKKEVRPYIHLQAEEAHGTANCGCRLENGESPCFWQCPLHAAAPLMLIDLKGLLDLFKALKRGKALSAEDIKDEIYALLVTITKAEGQTK